MVIDVLVRGDVTAIVRHLESLANVKSVQRIGETPENTCTLRVESSNNTDIRESVSREIVNNGFGLLGLVTSDMSLEDVFVQLVTKEETH
jgi:ABC-2 type transport system ATP-binding protein